jgi:hypothetical protein
MAEEKKGRDWLAIGISLFSLGISAFTAYHSILLKRDDVRLVVDEALQVRREKNEFTIPEVQEFAFVNSGNRQAVVSGIYGMLVLVTKPGDAAAQCNQKLPLHKSIYLDASPVVLKAGEMQVVQAKVVAEYPWRKQGDGTFRFKEDGAVEGAANYVVCLLLYVTTPDSSSIKWAQPLYTLPGKADAGEKFPKNEPLVILQATRIGFLR